MKMYKIWFKNHDGEKDGCARLIFEWEAATIRDAVEQATAWVANLKWPRIEFMCATDMDNIDLASGAMKWTEVSERLPDANIQCLCVMHGGALEVEDCGAYNLQWWKEYVRAWLPISALAPIPGQGK